MSNLPNPIVPGRYTTRNGKRAIVRHVETELAVSGDYVVTGFRDDSPAWIHHAWTSTGVSGNGKSIDLISVGWTVEFVPGKKYRHTETICTFLCRTSSGKAVFELPDGTVSRCLAPDSESRTSIVCRTGHGQ